MTLPTPRITPHLWFDKEAIEAANFYVGIFPESTIDSIDTIKDTPSGDCDIVAFTLARQPFMAISAGPMFRFNEAISLLVPCESQEEIDHYHATLAADPVKAQCGWIKDKYGLSWQIWPRMIAELSSRGDAAAKARLTRAIMASTKFDVAALKRAFDGASGERPRSLTLRRR